MPHRPPCPINLSMLAAGTPFINTPEDQKIVNALLDKLIHLEVKLDESKLPGNYALLYMSSPNSPVLSKSSACSDWHHLCPLGCYGFTFQSAHVPLTMAGKPHDSCGAVTQESRGCYGTPLCAR
jgi:hypothetical protein